MSNSNRTISGWLSNVRGVDSDDDDDVRSLWSGTGVGGSEHDRQTVIGGWRSRRSGQIEQLSTGYGNSNSMVHNRPAVIQYGSCTGSTMSYVRSDRAAVVVGHNNVVIFQEKPDITGCDGSRHYVSPRNAYSVPDGKFRYVLHNDGIINVGRGGKLVIIINCGTINLDVDATLVISASRGSINYRATNGNGYLLHDVKNAHSFQGDGA